MSAFLLSTGSQPTVAHVAATLKEMAGMGDAHRRVMMNNEILLQNMKQLLTLSIHNEEVLANLLKFCSHYISQDNKKHLQVKPTIN